VIGRDQPENAGARIRLRECGGQGWEMSNSKCQTAAAGPPVARGISKPHAEINDLAAIKRVQRDSDDVVAVAQPFAADDRKSRREWKPVCGVINHLKRPVGFLYSIPKFCVRMPRAVRAPRGLGKIACPPSVLAQGRRRHPGRERSADNQFNQGPQRVDFCRQLR
jgi:hypothetical protein